MKVVGGQSVIFVLQPAVIVIAGVLIVLVDIRIIIDTQRDPNPIWPCRFVSDLATYGFF